MINIFSVVKLKVTVLAVDILEAEWYLSKTTMYKILLFIAA